MAKEYCPGEYFKIGAIVLPFTTKICVEELRCHVFAVLALQLQRRDSPY